jgi:leucine dehydrogenase
MPVGEELVRREGKRSGLQVVIAVDSTALGPALGGCRMWHYDSPGDGVDDALRLAHAMTLKAAAAGLDLGGGKGVICLPNGAPPPDQRKAVLLDFADAVESLGGRYITAEDVGTCADDMALIASRSEHVVGMPAKLGGRGDPSPLTARGVERAIRACCAHRFGSSNLAGIRVCVVGVGHVGLALVGRLCAAGAEVVAGDIDESRRAVAEELGASWVEPGAAMLTECDVLAPCALGGVVDARNVEWLRCSILCGAANNVLADDELAERLQSRGILYAPDFIANAGGLIHVYADLHRHPETQVDDLVDSIGETIESVLAEADGSATTPLDAARELARRRLEAAPATVRDWAHA